MAVAYLKQAIKVRTSPWNETSVQILACLPVPISKHPFLIEMRKRNCRGVPVLLPAKKRKQHEHECPAWKNEPAICQLEFILIFSSGKILAINSDTELVSMLSLLSFLTGWLVKSSLWIKCSKSPCCKVFVELSLNWAQYQKWTLKLLKSSCCEKSNIVL